MKNCVSCGKEIKETAKFCPFCGTEQPAEVVTDLPPVSSVEDNTSSQSSATDISATEDVTQATKSQEKEAISSPEPDKGASEKKSANPNTSYGPQVEAVAKTGRNYFNFLNRNVLAPEMNFAETDYNGLISLGLLSLFSAISISRTIGTIFNWLGSGETFPFFFEIFLWIVVAFLVNVVVLFGFNKQILHENTNFLEVTNRLFAPVSVGVYISAVALLLSLILSAPSTFFFILVWLPFVLVNISFVGNLWMNANRLKQRFYLVLAALAANSILAFIVARIFLNILSSKIQPQDLINGFFSQLMNY